MKILVDSNEMRNSNSFYLYQNGKFPRFNFKSDNNIYIKPYSHKADFYKDLDVLKDLIDTNYFKSVFPDEENIIKYPDISILKMKRNDYKCFSIYSNVFEDELIYSRTFDKGLIFSIKFKERDRDIKSALFRGMISPIIARTLIITRDLTIGDSLDVPIRRPDYVKTLYKHYQIPKKKKGEFRDIYEPVENFKEIMKELNMILQAYFNTKEKKRTTNQYAYIKDRNIVGNAKIHRNNQTVVKVDISKFFESIKPTDCDKYIKFLCLDSRLREEFTNTIFNFQSIDDNESPNIDEPVTVGKVKRGLFMGNPISGTLANLIMYKVSISLENIFASKGMAVSIYSDDITVSAPEGVKISKEMVESIIEYTFRKHKLDHFKIKPAKTKKLTKQNRRVCGVTINHENKITTKKSEYSKIRVMLYKLSNGENINIPLDTLFGRINFHRYVDETGKYEKLLNKYKTTLENLGFNVEKVNTEVLV